MAPFPPFTLYSSSPRSPLPFSPPRPLSSRNSIAHHCQHVRGATAVGHRPRRSINGYHARSLVPHARRPHQSSSPRTHHHPGAAVCYPHPTPGLAPTILFMNVGMPVSSKVIFGIIFALSVPIRSAERLLLLPVEQALLQSARPAMTSRRRPRPACQSDDGGGEDGSVKGSLADGESLEMPQVARPSQHAPRVDLGTLSWRALYEASPFDLHDDLETTRPFPTTLRFLYTTSMTTPYVAAHDRPAALNRRTFNRWTNFADENKKKPTGDGSTEIRENMEWFSAMSRTIPSTKI
ncbi:hypothetical protein B0H17DRAFT_1215560 [Mycena rosella]|uniref:Uncharacterized protein n=1 Tax=Mycena rosella TaxID=1033263 RepID=A0AAD7CHD8_MYCRO|nr:hypothetical protein B0H17DRAFT_1215560 [Mycena rosella]